jgi:diguanylate cyclase (GGDEF)-like protein
MASDPSTAELIERAWELTYLDPQRALETAHQVIALTLQDPHGIDAGFGWLQVALAEVRVGDPQVASDAVSHAREVFQRNDHVRGIALADEVRAIHLRRCGDIIGSAALQEAIDTEAGRGYTDHDQFVAHNSRAITCKHLGRVDDALRHFYHAYAAARRTGWHGPEIVALGNLGGFHQDLYNLDDARSLSEKAMQLAREVHLRQTVGVTAANLIVNYHAAGQPAQARAMVEFLMTHEDELLPGTLERLSVQMALAFFDAGEIETAQRYLDRGAISLLGDGDGKTFWSWVQARCHLSRGDASAALAVLGQTITAVEVADMIAQPYDLLQIYRVAADASEQLGDLAAALAFTRRSHKQYEELVGRSARARYIALEVAHQVDSARHERDQAMASRDTAEDARRRLAALNHQLQAKIAETESLQAQLKEQALRDPLTGLHNRRYLFEVAPRLLHLAERQGGSMCLAMIDLDRFKTLNDTYGHKAGDDVLLAFAGLLAQNLRRTDVFCRYGGEEFVIVMPDMTVSGAEIMLARLLKSFAELRVSTSRQTLPACSFSAGIAVFPRHGNTLDLLLAHADRALYAAKDAGRSRIEIAQNTGFSTFN